MKKQALAFLLMCGISLVTVGDGCAAPSQSPLYPAHSTGTPAVRSETADELFSVMKPRDLGDLEKAAILSIALQEPETRVWLDKGLQYRTSFVWIFQAGSDWNVASYELKDRVEKGTDRIYHPGVQIGFGSPQVHLVVVAVDSSLASAVYVRSFADVPRHAAGLHYLSDTDRSRLTDLAAAAANVSGDAVEKAEYVWIGLSKDLQCTFEYDAVEVGIPEFAWSQALTYYPGVRFRLGNPPATIRKVTVDLSQNLIVQVEDYPIRIEP
jgi:hypothetical protein